MKNKQVYKNNIYNKGKYFLIFIFVVCLYCGTVFAESEQVVEKVCVKDIWDSPETHEFYPYTSPLCSGGDTWEAFWKSIMGEGALINVNSAAHQACVEKEPDMTYAVVYVAEQDNTVKVHCEPQIIRYKSNKSLTPEEKVALVDDAVSKHLLDGTAKYFVNIFGRQVWDVARFLKKNNGQNSGTSGEAVVWKASVDKNVGSLCRLGLLISFMMIIIQVVIDFTSMVMGQGMHPITVLQKNIVKILIVAICLTPGVYKKFMTEMVAPITDSIANVIWADYSKRIFSGNRGGGRSAQAVATNTTLGLYGKMIDKQGVIRSVEMSPAKVKLGKDLVVTLFACLVFTIASVLTLIFPLLQSAVFIVAFYLGPLCIPFVLLDVTSGIFKNWVSFVLTICFWGVIGSLVFWVGTLADVQGGFMEASVNGEFVTMIAFGLLSIFLFVMSFPISASIFGSGGGAMGIMSGVAGIVGMASGGAIVGSLLLGGGSKMLGYGSSMAGWTLKGVGMKSAGQWLSESAKSMDSFGGGMINSAVEQSKKASGERTNLRDMGKAAGVGGSMLRNHRKALDKEKSRVANVSSSGVEKAKNNWNSAIYSNLREAAERHGYEKEDLATVQFDSSGENIVAASMDTGEQFRVGEGGGFELVDNSKSDVTTIAAGLKLSAADKRDMREMSDDMLKKIRSVGSPIRDRVNETLAGTGFTVRDIASVQMSRDGDMMGLTMKGGEQFAYNNGNLESRL